MSDLTDEKARKVLEAAGWDNPEPGIAWYHDECDEPMSVDLALKSDITTVALLEALGKQEFQLRVNFGQLDSPTRNAVEVNGHVASTLNEAVIAAWLALEADDA